MASDLLIYYPDIPQAATRVIQGTQFVNPVYNEQELHPALNTTKGERWQLWQSSSNTQAHYICYDLGPFATKSANFMIVSKMNEIVKDANTIAYELASSSDDYSSTTVVSTAADVDALTLVGPNTQDFLVTFAASAVARYWRVGFGTAGPTWALKVGKIYFGTALDLGVDVDDYDINLITKSTRFVAQAGPYIALNSYDPRYELRLNWRGISNAALETFFRDVHAHRNDTTFFLGATNYTAVLDNNSLLHVRLLEAKTDGEDKDNYNNLYTVWEQALG